MMKRNILCISCLCFSLTAYAVVHAAPTAPQQTYPQVIIKDSSGDTLELESNGGVPVNIQDQHTPIMIVPMSKVSNTTALSSQATLDTSTIVVDSATGFIDGAFIVIASVSDDRYYTGHQVGAIATNTVTLDTPLDFTYSAGTQVTNGSDELSVDGSSTTQVFSLRSSDPGLPLEVDITRIIILMTCSTAVDLSLFGNITALTNGIVLRKSDGTYNNIFNVKSNADFASIMFDFAIHDADNPIQGQDGLVGRLTFASPGKIGVTIRVGPDEDLELLIQDNLVAISSFKIMVEGHVVTD